jgi:hypothetical protein
MIFPLYIIVEPGADRPLFSHSYPKEYVEGPHLKKGAKVFVTNVVVPGFDEANGRIVERLEDQEAWPHKETT